MESPVAQSNGPSPLLELSGYTFRKIVVDQVVDADGTRHEVMFVTAHKNGKLYIINMQASSFFMCVTTLTEPVWRRIDHLPNIVTIMVNFQNIIMRLADVAWLSSHLLFF